MSANLQLPEWLEPDYLQRIQSILENKNTAEIVFGNSRVQLFIVGKQNIFIITVNNDYNIKTYS